MFKLPTIPIWRHNLKKRKPKRKWTRRANQRAGNVQYNSKEFSHYPEWMPSTTKGKSEPIVGLWHMRRVLMWRLGYVYHNGRKCDDWMTYEPDKIAYFHKLIEWADKKLKVAEEKYYERIKQKDKELREGILKNIWDQTDAIVAKHAVKQCLNQPEIGEPDMAKKSFEEMMQWSDSVKDYEGSGVNFMRFNEGIYCMRLLSAEDQDYFMTYTQHDCGQKKDFRSWMCWDFIMENEEVREYFDSKNMITEEDAIKAKKYGDPICSTLEVISKYVKSMEPIYSSIRTKTRCIINSFFVFQAYPEDIKESERIKPGNYIIEKSLKFNKDIISAMKKSKALKLGANKKFDPLDLISIDRGKILVINSEGEGVGKNKRTYSFDFDGDFGPIVFCEDGSNPFDDENEKKVITLPEDFEVYNLLDVLALRYLPYQACINNLKAIPSIGKLLNDIGYEIPGDEPSDNPLDENYDKNFAKRTVGKPIKVVKKLNEESPLSQTLKPKKEAWEDEKVIEKERKQIQSKTVVIEDEEEEIIFDEEDVEIEAPKKQDSFSKRVPPSDPKKEVITNAPKKRKIF